MNAIGKVSPGDSLIIPATIWNGLMDMLADYKRTSAGGTAGASGRAGYKNTGLVRVVNNTGNILNRNVVVGLDAPIYDPNTDYMAFRNSIVFSGVIPLEPDHIGKFAITSETIPAGATGWAIIDGITVCETWFPDPDTITYADISPINDLLLARPRGKAQILWADSPGYPPGPRWAVVRLGAGGAVPDLPDNANKKYGMVPQLSDDVGAVDDPTKWTLDYIRAHP